MYFMYCNWRKGMSRDEATSNSEEIKPLGLKILGLVMPTQYCQAVMMKSEDGFYGDIVGQESPNL